MNTLLKTSMLVIGIAATCSYLLADDALVESKGTGVAPSELGKVHWIRGFDSATKMAKDHNKPLLVLFQEVPGCDTCVGYGNRVLSHPLIVEAAETLFVPVAIYNNIKGADEQTLKSFQEKAWNNPVVRIVQPDRKPLAPRVADDYTVAGLAGSMVRALVTADREVPTYLRLLSQESAARRGKLEKATFAMHCFWEGEAALGAIEGVYSTMPGFLDDLEVVELEYDPKVIGYDKLLSNALAQQCASKVFARSAAQEQAAEKLVSQNVKRTDDTIRADKQPKYYLSNTPLKHVPMTQLQACRVNSALGGKHDPREYLSKRQIKLLQIVEQHPRAGWPVVIGASDLAQAWRAARVVADSISGE